MLRGRRDRHHRLGLLIPLTVALHRRRRSSSPSATPPRARSPRTSRSSSRRWSACRDRARTSPSTSAAAARRTASRAGIGIPGLDSLLVGFSTDTEVIGLDTVAARRAAAGEHDAALGLRRHGRDRHAADRARAVARRSPGGGGATSRRSKWFLRAVAVSGVAVDRGAGVRLDRDRGRPPAVDRLRGDANRGGGHRRQRHLGHVRPSCWCSTPCSASRRCSCCARWRGAGARPTSSTADGARTARRQRPHRRARRRRGEQRRRRRRRPVGRRDALRGLRRRRLRRRASGRWSPAAASAGRRARGADRLGDRPGLGGEPRLADLRARGALDRRSRARSRRSSRRCSSRSASPPSGSSCAAPGSRSTDVAARRSRPACSPRRCSAISSLLTPFFMGTVAGAIAVGRVPVGNATGDPVTSWLNPLSLLIGALFVATGAYLPRSSSSATRAAPATPTSSATSRTGRSAPRSRRERSAFAGAPRPARRRALPLRRAGRARRCRS